jgi:hypothetical protein
MLRCYSCTRRCIYASVKQPIDFSAYRLFKTPYTTTQSRCSSNTVETAQRSQNTPIHRLDPKLREVSNKSSNIPHHEKPASPRVPESPRKEPGNRDWKASHQDRDVGKEPSIPIYKLPGREISKDGIKKAKKLQGPNQFRRVGSDKLTNASAKMHQSILGDPLKLADTVRVLLRQEHFEKAQDIVRSASVGSVQYIVSWNHLIDWQMSRGKVNGAMKTYQEVRSGSTLRPCNLLKPE